AACGLGAIVGVEEGASLGWQAEGRRERRQIEYLERTVPAEAEVRVVRADQKALPLADHGEVRWLLELDDQRAGADRMRDARRHEENVSRLRPHVVQRAEEGFGVLALDPFAVPLGRDSFAQPEPSFGVVSTRRDDDPGFRLAELGAQVFARERSTRVRMHGEPVSGVEELDEHAWVAPVGRILGERVAQKASVFEPCQPGLGLVATGVARGGHGRDPILGKLAVSLRLAAQAVDHGASPVEAVDPRGADSVHCHRTFTVTISCGRYGIPIASPSTVSAWLSSSSPFARAADANGMPRRSRAVPRPPCASYRRSTRASESSARLIVSSTRFGSSTEANELAEGATVQRSGALKRAASATTPASRQPPACGSSAYANSCRPRSASGSGLFVERSRLSRSSLP